MTLAILISLLRIVEVLHPSTHCVKPGAWVYSAPLVSVEVGNMYYWTSSRSWQISSSWSWSAELRGTWCSTDDRLMVFRLSIGRGGFEIQIAEER